MDRIVDTEFLPDQESLFPLEEGGKNSSERRPLEIWRSLDLRPEKISEVAAMRGQQEALRRLRRDSLAEKFLSFAIIYAVASLIVMFLRAFVSRYVPGFRSPDTFLIFIASHFIYLGSLMLFSLAYGLYVEWGWRVALVVALFVIVFPLVNERLVMPGSLTLAIFSAVIMVAVVFTMKRTRLWKRLRSRITEERQSNIENNHDRAAFRAEVETFLRAADEESGKVVRRWRIFKWLRRRVIRSSLDVLYLILTGPDFVDRKQTLGEYAKRHRFKDSMGRLATVVWSVGAIAHLIFPKSSLAGGASLVAANVLPVYVVTMFVMDQLDEAHEEVFNELGRLIRPDREV